MSTLLKTDVDRTAHDQRISTLTQDALRLFNAGLSAKEVLADLSQEQAKCEALGCFDGWRHG